MKQFVLISLGLFGQLMAAHSNMGGYLTYKYLDSGRYEITHVRYKDCNGISLSASPLVLRAGSGNWTLTTTLVSTRDITPIPTNCSVQSRCKGNYSYGFEESISTVRIDTDTFPGCQFLIESSECCRSSMISTGSANESRYYFTSFSTCNNDGHNSPRLTSVPPFVFFVNQDVNVSLAAESLDPDLDSVSYQLVAALTAQNTSVTYSGSYSGQKPFMFFGFPNANSSPPTGLTLDPQTGNLRFRPTQNNQFGVYSVEIKAWKLVQDTMRLVSTIHTDFLGLVIQQPNNKVPAFQESPQIIDVCSGTEACFTVTTKDGDNSDQLYVSLLSTLPGLTLTRLDNNTTRPEYRICWTPDTSHIRASPHLVTLNVSDSACGPLIGQSTLSWGFKVGPPFPAGKLPMITKTAVCNGVILKATDTANAGLSFSWSMGAKTYSGDSAFLSAEDTGWHHYSLIIHNADCDLRKSDSFHLDTVVKINTQLNTGTPICWGDSVALNLSSTAGAPPFTYNLNGTTITPGFAVMVYDSVSFGILTVDDNGCLASDSFTLKSNPKMIIDAGPDIRRCLQVSDSIILTASGSGGTGSLNFNWLNIGSGKSLLYTLPPSNSTIILELGDASGCKLYDTVGIVRYNGPKANAGPDLSVCGTTTVVLSASGFYPPNTDFYWCNYGQGRSFQTSVFSTKEFILETNDSFGCLTTDTMKITVLPKPSINAGPDVFACPDEMVLASGQASGGTPPYVYTWTYAGNTVFGRSVFLKATQNGPATFSVTDFLGCAVSDPFYLLIKNPPVVTVTPIGNPLCEDNAPVNLYNQVNPPGGIWSGAGINGQIFMPAQAGPGIHWLKYRYTGTNGCSDEDSLQLDIREKPVVLFTSDVTSGKVALTVNFSILTTGNYVPFWEFGDPASNKDTSSLASPAYTYTAIGKYPVSLTLNDGVCSEKATKANYITVLDTGNPSGLSELLNTPVSLYPNPARETITVKVDTDKPFVVELTDLQGRLLLKRENQQWKCELGLGDLAPAVYILRLETEVGSRVFRILKE